MLAIQIYRFPIGTKIPFSQWPGIVQTFLAGQNLQYDRFLYYFCDNIRCSALPKIMKDCPHIGPIHTQSTNAGEHRYLSNIEEDTACPAEKILSVVPKIHRSYGLSEACLIYQDIDFFGQKIPAVLQAPGNTPWCIMGSCIILDRNAVFPKHSSISLRIMIHNGTDSFDPVPYAKAMGRLLPGIRCMGSVKYCLTAEEQLHYDGLNEKAAPFIQQARAYFAQQLPQRLDYAFVSRINPPNFSVAPVLKRLGKERGYSYIKHENGNFHVLKRTASGHCIMLNVDVGPMFKGVDVWIHYTGAGFSHSIGSAFCYPKDQEDLESYLLQIFRVLSAAEENIIAPLDTLYPPTPQWYSPVN